MDDIAVIDASPLIFLSRGGHVGLLRSFARRNVVPRAVFDETLRKPDDMETARSLDLDWLEVVPNPPVPEPIQSWGLGLGESSVLAFAASAPGAVAVVDDRAARKCAASMDIPVRGTLGIVLVAKQRGIVPSARTVLNDLVEGGMYLDPEILEAALKRVGE